MPAAFAVSILVVMDIGLRRLTVIRTLKFERLNPCCDGYRSATTMIKAEVVGDFESQSLL